MSTTKPLIGFRRADTRMGDSIQAIAARELGDASKWYDLVQINGLLPPYITDDLAAASATVLLAGQQSLKVPSPSPAVSGITDADAVLGVDISLAGGRLEATDMGDLQIISGGLNYGQAIRNRLETHTGDLLYHPTYGCDVYQLVGGGGTETANRLAVSRVVRAIRSDQRTALVDQATGSIVGDTITVTATAVSVDGKRVPTGISTAAPAPAAPGGPASAPVVGPPPPNPIPPPVVGPVPPPDVPVTPPVVVPPVVLPVDPATLLVSGII